MSEYEQLRLMYHQEYLLKEKKLKYELPWEKWKNAKQVIKGALSLLNDNEIELSTALKLSLKSLGIMQAMDDNPPLKKISLDKMNGEPVWVVSYNHNGRWGIVDSSNQSVWFHTKNGEEQEFWFDDRYIFRYKKEIINHEEELKHGISNCNLHN